ncbi:MAG: hypothetical protein M3N53_06410 [Actinomycetota bacterium]|nr:hypothetical protein [Actinomycetota bacterium]
MLRKLISLALSVLMVTSLTLSTPVLARDVDLQTPAVIRWATVLCRFADSRDVPHDQSYYADLMKDEFPGIEHYWEDVSYGRIDFVAPTPRGWYELPRGRAYYTANEPWEVPERALRDCLKKAEANLYMPLYEGVNLWFSGALTNRGWGVRRPFQLDDRSKVYGVTIMSEPTTWTTDNTAPQGILAHEMGHGLGLQHSGGGPHEEFSSYWDVMSSIGTQCGYQNLPEFSCIPVHPIAFQKRRLGWIHDEEVVTVRPGQEKVFYLKPLSQPALDGLFMAKVPLHGDIPGYLTVEARTPTGYDEHTLGEAVILHRWNPRATQATGDHPYLVGRTYRDGSADWSGEMWVAGETYEHRQTGIKVSILSRTDDGRFAVRITSP